MLDLRATPALDGDGPVAAAAEWRALCIDERLAGYDPVDVSSLASGLHAGSSELEVVCDLRAGGFVAAATAAYGDRPRFRHRVSGARTVVAFEGAALVVELVGEARPVRDQPAYRHAVAHRRLARLGGAPFAEWVRALRGSRGLKTERAIAALLGLGGDPYTAVDRLAEAPDDHLAALLTRARPLGTAR